MVKKILLLGLLATQVNATSIVVTGTPGSNVTTWVFNGNTNSLPASPGNAFGEFTTRLDFNNWRGGFFGDPTTLDYISSSNAFFTSNGQHISGSAVVMNQSTNRGSVDFLGVQVSDVGTGGVNNDRFSFYHGTNGGSGDGTFLYIFRDRIEFTDYTVRYTGFDITLFDQAAAGASITNVGDTFTTTYVDPSAGDLSLTFTAVAPEPSTSVLTALGALFLLGRRKR